MTITRERLLEVLDYDVETGVFRWKVKTSRKINIGQIAGTVTHGYVQIRIDGVIYRAHRLAWLYVLGEWPASDVDHRDRCRSNNRWSNLRLATKSQNQGNTAPWPSNTSGFKGVTWNKKRKRWYAQITIRGVVNYLGSFLDINDAALAYKNAATKYFGEFARTV
jgi:hypothetical protein